MATSAGNGAGGTLLIPVIGAAVLGVPVLAVMALAFSDFNIQVDAANSPREAEIESDRPSPASHGAPLGLFSGGGASKPRLNLLGRAAPPAPRAADEVDVRIAPLLAGALGQEPGREETPAGAPTDDVVMTEAPAGAPVGQMAMLQSGGQNWGGAQGGAGSGYGWGGYGGMPGFGGGASGAGGAPGFGGAPQGQQASTPTSVPPTFSPTPQGQPPIASLTPPTPPSSQPPATPPAGPGPIVLGPGDVLKGNGPGAPVTNDGGTLAAGHSPGEMTLTGDYVQNSGTTEVEIFGLGAGEFDFYIVEDDAIFNGGTISFVFGDGFDFSNSFDLAFLTADSVTFGTGFLGFTFAGTIFDPLDFDELFDVFVESDGPGRERLMLSFFAPLPQQQANNPQENRVAQAPEPEALFLFGLGLLGLAAARRRLA